MSQIGLQTAPSRANEIPQVSVAILEDLLYEMLAVGLDPRESKVTQKEIQQFLYEHARVSKAQQEFLDFFQSHGLSTEPESEAKPALPLPLPEGLESAGLQPPPVPESVPADADGVPEAPRVKAGPPVALVEPALPDSLALPDRLPVEERRARPSVAFFAVGGALAAVMVLLALAVAVGYSRLVDLSEELRQTRTTQAQVRHAVQSVDDGLTLLKSKSTDTSDSLDSLQYKIDRLVETVAPEPAPLETR